MAVVTGDRYLDSLVKFVDTQKAQLVEGALVLKLNPVGLHYVQSRLEALSELEGLVTGAPVDYLRAYVCDLGDHRALEQLRRILRLLTSLKVVSVLPHPARDPTPISLLPFGRLKVLELRGCDLSTSAARGLLQLRHTLEKIICHNSTDALRHVFASRIAEIKGSPQWNRLSFVSCACNDLVLMDESLQLLPVVETLDISRNKFTKVDNLRKCTRLKHLDLGFNQLRTVASFSEVSCQIVKLVLRNNALTSLRGIENLKLLEGLDLSYNIISNFFELEILSGLQCLQNLWLEGNPLSCARWYRAQVFSFFPHPDKLNLDEKKISTEEYWKRHIVIASRQKRPASFGFYSPAKCDDELERFINIKRRKHSRLASIQSEEQVFHIGSDLESVSCDNEIQTREENIISEEEGEIVGLMNRIELMKKERSARWLQEFKEWLIQDPEKYVHASKYNGVTLDSEKEHCMRSKANCRFVGESSRYVSDSVQASGDESSTNILESDSSFADVSSSFNTHQYIDRMSDSASNLPLRRTSEISVFSSGRMDIKQEQMISGTNGSFPSVGAGKRHFGSLAVTGERGNGNNCITPNIADDIVESDTPSVFPGSPPHYQEDILQRRHNLEEEFLQLSAESFSMASSDSITSCGDDDISEFGPVIPESDQSLMEVFSVRSGHLSIHHAEDKYYERRRGSFKGKQNGIYLAESRHELTSHARRRTDSDHSIQQWYDDDDDDDGFSHSEYSGDATHCLKQKGTQMKKKKNCRKKPKKRLVMLSGESNGVEDRTPGVNGYLNVYVSTGDDERRKEIISRSVLMSVNSKHMEDTTSSHTNIGATSHSGLQCSSQEAEGFIENYFNSNIADMKIRETCKQCILCNCILEQKTGHEEREVALVVSSEEKFYVLLLDAKNDGSGVSIRLIDWHKIEDITEVLVGLGLQLLRLYFGRGATYLFTTRCVDKSRQLLCILYSFDSDIKEDKFSINSLEQVQVRLFNRHVCGDSKVSIYQYSMALFWKNNMKEDVWLSRSLFVLEKHLLVCAEDFVQFGSISGEMSSSPYFSLDSWCFISDVSEMVIDTRQSWGLSLTVKCATSQLRTSRKEKVEEARSSQETSTSGGPLQWKFKWSSEDSMSNFIALVKAIHRGLVVSSSSPLVVRSVCD